MFAASLLITAAGCDGERGATRTQEVADPVRTLGVFMDSVFGLAISPSDPGVVAFVGFGGRPIQIRGYGLADVQTGAENSSTTNVRIASVSKQFTAMAILALVGDDLLALDQSVGAILGEPYFDDITVEQLLTHRSGLPDNEAIWMESWDPNHVATNADLVQWYVEQRPSLLFPPGTEWEYSQAGYNLLANIVEAVSGEPLEVFARRRLFGKIGLESATFFSLARATEIPNRAATYTMEDGEYRVADGHFLNGLVGGDGVFMNAVDYLRWDKAVRAEILVPPELHRRALSPRTEVNDRVNEQFARAFSGLPLSPSTYGYGWFLSESPDGMLAWHQGGWYGVQAVVIRDVDGPLTIGMFGNTDEIPLSMMASLYTAAREFEASLEEPN